MDEGVTGHNDSQTVISVRTEASKMPGYTEGPWRVWRTPREHPMTMVLPPEAQIVDGEFGKTPTEWIADDVRGQANAQLIAAAPDMYEALSPFAARYARIARDGDRPLKVLVPFEWLEQAAAAIARADGEKLEAHNAETD